jgi:phosphoribosylformylglycinamidine cyclo-ligase
MTTQKSQYQQLGVDASKGAVRRVFKRIVQNDFPAAFVNIVRDPYRPGIVKTMHTDGDGSKFVQRILHFRETGDATIIQGAVDDAFSMNKGDIAASGFVFGPWDIVQIININGLTVPKKLIMEQINERVESLLALYRKYGFDITFMGGETADLPDQVQSVVYDVAIRAETEEKNLITGNVQPGDVIFGFTSDGQAAWETTHNYGLMSNGLTLARIKLMYPRYGVKYRYLIGNGRTYSGRYLVTDKPDILGGATISQALLSPTRQWAIFIRLLIEGLKRQGIFQMLHGISMNTGGGATKITHVGEGIQYTKVMPEPPPLFRLIQAESGEKWRDMYQGFNCGVGLDVVGENDCRFMQALVDVSQQTAIKLFRLGACQQSPTGKNRVDLDTPYGRFNDYDKAK